VYTAPASIPTPQAVAVTASNGSGFDNSAIAVIQLSPSAPPSPISVVTGGGSSFTQTFAFTFSDTGGYRSFSVLDVLINSALDGRQACYIAFVPSGANSGAVDLVDDRGDAGGPYSGMVLPGSGTVSNSQCSVNGALSAVNGNGNTLTLTLTITFSAAFSGNKVIYLSAQDTSPANSGWQALGAWNVPGAPPSGPWVTGMTPAQSDNSLTQTYIFTFTDTNCWQDIGVANVLINSAIDGRHACYLAFLPGSGALDLVDDAGDAGGPYSGMVLPGSGTVSNSQCTVSGVGSSFSGSGNTLTVTLSIAFNAGFAGNRVFFLAARSNALNSGWQALGSVTVP